MLTFHLNTSLYMFVMCLIIYILYFYYVENLVCVSYTFHIYIMRDTYMYVFLHHYCLLGERERNISFIILKKPLFVFFSLIISVIQEIASPNK